MEDPVPHVNDGTSLGPSEPDREWRSAVTEVALAQRLFIEADRLRECEATDWRRAWLRLWHAQENLRRVEHARDDAVTANAALPKPARTPDSQ